MNVPTKFEICSFILEKKLHLITTFNFIVDRWCKNCITKRNRSTVSNIFNIVALSVPQIIGGTQKIWTVPGYALAPFSRKFVIGFYSD